MDISLPLPNASPSDWLVQHADLLARDQPVLDLASGRGRHALWLAAAGFHVCAVDRDPEKLEALAGAARARGVTVETRALDLERGDVDLGLEEYGSVVVFNYLHRPLFPALIRSLKPGGVLVYETFTAGQAARGHPRNPAFLLQDGELPRLVAPLQIISSREGEFGGKLIASIAARKGKER